LDPELRIATHPAGELTVHLVEYRAEEDQPSGRYMIALKYVVQSQETAKEVADGECIGYEPHHRFV
jgi:hypothetical protein